jgi:HK97 family phage portal protein
LSFLAPLFGVPTAAGGGNPLDDRYYDLPSTGMMSRAGVRVSPDTAMKVSAVYRCVSILANILAMFPKGMFERLPRGRQEAPQHPLDPIISFKPNRRQSAFEFWRQVCYHLVLRQNAYVQIVPGSAGRGWVGELVPLHPDRISGPEELADGRLRYEYKRQGRDAVRLLGGIDIWHLTGLSSDGLKGLSMIDVASDSIGVSMAAEQHAARFFERGVKPAGILQHERTLTPRTAEEMGESFRRKWGGEQGVGGVPVLWEGMKFVPVAMTLKDAEFLDSRKFSVAEIARWFGVPPHMVGDVERSTSWGTGIEQQGLHFLIYSLQPWVELLEQSIRFTLVVQPERYYPKFNVNALLRMDSKTQADVFGKLIDKGVLSPNECRELLERNPREGGDEYVDPAAKSAPPPPPPVPPSPDEPQPDEPQPDEPQPDKSQAVAARATALARARAEELVAEEGRQLRELATKHSKDEAGWRAAVAGFYGRFAAKVESSLACSNRAAKQWCESRRSGVLGAAGLISFQTTQQRVVEALVGMALGGK